MNRYALCLATMLLTTACGTTVFHADFDAPDNVIGSVPATAQRVGQVTVESGSGAISVVASPGATPSTKWVRIWRPDVPTPGPESVLMCQLVGATRPTRYVLTATLYIQSGTDMATVQFEPPSSPGRSRGSFLHLDFMPEGDVRIDDGAVRFGRVPRDQPFLLIVALDISPTAATARITLSGRASGSQDYTIDPRLLPIASQFGVVKFWMGFQRHGALSVDDIIVTRRD
jgi:hypothetical protein